MNFNGLRYQDPRTNTYLGSPSFALLPNGDMLASHDYFGPGCPGDPVGKGNLSSLYRLADDGATWHNISHIMSCEPRTAVLTTTTIPIASPSIA